MITTVFLVSILASLVITPGVIRIASAWELYDQLTGGRRERGRRTPPNCSADLEWAG